MRDALETSTERTPAALDDMSPDAADPDHLTTDLVRKVMEKSGLQAGRTGGANPNNRSVAQAKLDSARAQRSGAETSEPEKNSALRRLAERMFESIRSYRPKPLHLRIVTIALVMVLSPWLIPILAVLTLTICAITYFTLGPDRIEEIAVSSHAWLEKKSPKRAETVKHRWETAVATMEKWAARLPEKWAPDLSWQKESPSEEMIDKMKVDPFDRLAAEARNT